MIRLLLLGALLLPWRVAGEARELDALLYDAVRYANTPERREAKASARAELEARMPDGLREAMRWVHGDRIMIQVLAMEWVMTQPDDVVVPVLLEFVDHEREDTRRVAIFFLGFKQAPQYADRVLPHVENEKTRGAALRTLGKWKVAEARPVAERWLVEGNERQRIVAANALRDLGDAACLPALMHALEDPVFTVRHAAARAILVLADTEPALLEGRAAETEMMRRILADAGLVAYPDDIVVEGGYFR